MREFAFQNGLLPCGHSFSTRSTALAALVAFIVSLNLACIDGKESSSNTGPDKQSLSTPASTSNTVASDSKPANSAPAGQDPFWMSAAEGGMAEIEMGKLASGKAQNADVKNFAEMMIVDHGKANEELKTLAGTNGITVPTSLSAEHQSQMTKLQGLSGAEFDKAYVEAMVAAHEKDVAMFRDKSQSASNADLKSFAAKNLPTLEKHLEMIKGIQSKTK